VELPLGGRGAETCWRIGGCTCWSIIKDIWLNGLADYRLVGSAARNDQGNPPAEEIEKAGLVVHG
jgi:hypothetical protein